MRWCSSSTLIRTCSSSTYFCSSLCSGACRPWLVETSPSSFHIHAPIELTLISFSLFAADQCPPSIYPSSCSCSCRRCCLLSDCFLRCTSHSLPSLLQFVPPITCHRLGYSSPLPHSVSIVFSSFDSFQSQSRISFWLLLHVFTDNTHIAVICCSTILCIHPCAFYFSSCEVAWVLFLI